MIIGISGKIGSGKDTVGQIIQYLTTHPENLKVNPVYNQGFEYTMNYSKQKEGFPFHNSNWEIKKFAGKLKQIASMLTGATLEQLEDQDFKKLDIGPDWGITYRELLQKLGTEAMRNGLHTNVWVNALFADYGKNVWDPTPNDFVEPNWIITDMRFPNEMDAVKARGGITIRVNRPKAKISTGDSVTDFVLNETKNFGIVEHPSETALDNHNFDFVIDNNGSISDLIDKVKEILTLNNII